jgi:hypothetical protein
MSGGENRVKFINIGTRCAVKKKKTDSFEKEKYKYNQNVQSIYKILQQI